MTDPAKIINTDAIPHAAKFSLCLITDTLHRGGTSYSLFPLAQWTLFWYISESSNWVQSKL